MNIEEIKNKILQLAIQGKLVKQNPNDTPASVLLEEIKAEKERLIKEKKIKKEKALPEITEEEKSFELPEGWEWCRFSEVLDVRDGTHDTPKYVERGIPLITSKNINGKDIDYSNVKYISLEDHEKICKRSNVDDGDILFAMIGSIGNPVIVKKKIEFSIKNVALFKFYDVNYVNNKFFYYYLLFIEQKMKDNSKGAVQSFVSLKFLREYIFPLPPLEEQKRIVQKVEELFAIAHELNENKEEMLKDIANTRNKVLQLAVQGKLVEQCKEDRPAKELLEEIKIEKERLIKEKVIKKEKALPEISEEEKSFELPEGWEYTKLGILSKKIHYGYTASAKFENENTDVKFLRITDIQNNKVDWGTVPFCEIDESKLKSLILNNNDILIARTGGTIGKSFIVKNVEYNSVFASYLIRVKPLNDINADYLKLFLESPFYWNQLQDKTMGTGQPNVNAVSLSNLIIPLPPLEEQKRIVHKVDEVMGFLDKLEKIILLGEVL